MENRQTSLSLSVQTANGVELTKPAIKLFPLIYWCIGLLWYRASLTQHDLECEHLHYPAIHVTYSFVLKLQLHLLLFSLIENIVSKLNSGVIRSRWIGYRRQMYVSMLVTLFSISRMIPTTIFQKLMKAYFWDVSSLLSYQSQPKFYLHGSN